jgi:RNA polymerase sigma factor (sigma-70 family)
MPDTSLPRFLRSLRSAIRNGGQADLTDADLLSRFVEHKDAAAFEVLVWRHAALVLAVCRRVLRRPADVDDAFQATFLIFLQRAASVRQRETVATWLYRVAYRTALRAQRSAARRSTHERMAPPRPAVESPPANVADEVQPALDEELNRLPEKYRAPLVLHYLQGLNKEETARLLCCPVGTVSSRLHRGQEQLRRRLVRRGVTLTAAGLGILLPREPAAALALSDRIRSFLQAALAVAAGRDWLSAGVSAPVMALARSVLKRMLLSRLAPFAAVLLVFGAIVGSTAIVRGSISADPSRAVAIAGRPHADAGRNQKGAGAEEAPKKSPDPFPNPPGYVWAVVPQDAGRKELSNDKDVTGTVETGAEGDLVVTVSHPPRYSRAGRPYYRPVALDADGRRFLFGLVKGSVNDGQAVNRYRLPPEVLPANRVRNVGVEELPPEGRKAAAEHAARLARDRGMEPLPLPEPGRAYEFALTAEDGRKIQSRDLLGKVVVIHCWAFWHQPSLEQRNQLKDLYRRRHKDGLEVIGVDLNNSGDKATGGRWWLSSPGKEWHVLDEGGPKEKAAAVGPIPWANVRVPRDLADRELWELASEIFALPRVLVLDRRGVLRFDTPRELSEAITQLLAEP